MVEQMEEEMMAELRQEMAEAAARQKGGNTWVVCLTTFLLLLPQSYTDRWNYLFVISSLPLVGN
jgi:hypothetical protein